MNTNDPPTKTFSSEHGRNESVGVYLSGGNDLSTLD